MSGDFSLIVFFIGVPVAILLFILACWVIIFSKRTSQSAYTFCDEYFEQAGVLIDFKKKSIRINGNTYAIDDIGTISRKNYNTGSVIIIEIPNDFQHPLHKISIYSDTIADEFYSRLNTAISRAGKYLYTVK